MTDNREARTIQISIGTPLPIGLAGLAIASFVVSGLAITRQRGKA